MQIEGFEPAGGRAVTRQLDSLFSPLAVALGYKPEGEVNNLDYIPQNAKASLRLLVLNNDLAPVNLAKAEAVFSARRYVNSLVTDSRGEYRYDATPVDTELVRKTLDLGAQGLSLPLPTTDAGDFLVTVRQPDGAVLAVIPYTVAGDRLAQPSALSTESLAKGDLRLKLDKQQYAPGDTIKMMATGAEFTLVEVGHMGATSLTPCSQLQAGEVGYLTASIKTVQDTRVGDTVTLAERPTAEALPGYRQVKPMVFCGIYPADGAKYPDLKDALEKLQLNDASLTFELETSAALGFGFRCGFLGLLHMEIITERLEREFDLDIITTTPSVRYRLTMTDGTVEMIDNPSSYPDPSNIVKQEEPFVDVHLYTPNDYVGALMDLCQQKRGVLIDMKYLDDVRVDLHYALPLGEIVYDFFDAIKSRSRGYASYDYEFKEYRESDLVKLDFLLNGDPVDALSMIVFRDNAYAKGRRICEKLRDNIPRTLFEIPVQAAIGGKIIARETVKAMRKDVLAKCYGGDISRKKKLLEKQKEGKKKMRQLGSVSLPSEAFTAVLKLDSTDD